MFLTFFWEKLDIRYLWTIRKYFPSDKYYSYSYCQVLEFTNYSFSYSYRSWLCKFIPIWGRNYYFLITFKGFNIILWHVTFFCVLGKQSPDPGGWYECDIYVQSRRIIFCLKDDVRYTTVESKTVQCSEVQWKVAESRCRWRWQLFSHFRNNFPDIQRHFVRFNEV